MSEIDLQDVCSEQPPDYESDENMSGLTPVNQSTENTNDPVVDYRGLGNDNSNKNGVSNGIINPAYSGVNGSDVVLTGYSGKDPDKIGNSGNGNATSNGNTVISGNDDDTAKKKEKKEAPKMVSMLGLFRFADKLDVLFMVVGTICAMCHGAALPILIIVFGSMANSFVDNGKSANLNLTSTADPMDSFMDQIKQSSLYYVAIGCAVIVVAYVEVTLWLITSYRQTYRVRIGLLSAVLRQEIGWFDTHDAGELSTRLSDDVNKIQEGLGDKISNFFQWMGTFISGIIIGFCYGWKLALVIFAISPLLAISGGIMTYLITNATNKELSAYAKAGAVAEEVLTAIRTVVAFSGQAKECERYNRNLIEAKDFGIKKGMFSGGGMGMVFFILFSSYALAFWYGGKLVNENEMQIGDMLIVFFCVVIGAFALGNAAPNLQAVGIARGAAYMIFDLIDRQSLIDSSSTAGLQPSQLIGNIELRNVHFKYPSRDQIPILNGLNMKVDRGKTVALVGSSGCGKSTVIQLLQRFYDPLDGEIMIDGVNVKDLNIKWLRQNIGVVSQEPVLFATTIAENIMYGKDGVTQAEIEQAAKEANAHDFISKLPQKYETLVGERGAQLSGGQKQRIAIARALVRDPKIVLLDEATSALDMESEAIVQSALDKVRLGRTTIIVAHRLSTIKTADIIYGFKDGVVHENGTHDELMALQGIYYQLVMNQKMHEETGEDIDEEEDQAEPEKASPLKRERLTSVGSDGRRRSLKRGKSLTDAEPISVGTDKKKEEKLPDPPMSKLFALNIPEIPFIIIGCISACVQGAIQPGFAILFAKFLGVFAILDPELQRQKILLYALLFIAIGAAAFISMFLQSTMFAISGERLTMKMRQLTFRALLRQDISFFDDHENSVGAMTTRLATDASAIQGATGVRLGMVFQSLAALGTGIIIGFIYSWQLTLLIIGFAPLLMIAAMLQMRLAKGFSGKNNAALEEAGKVATEGISNIRTVACLSKEARFISEYQRLIDTPYQENLKKAHIYGFSFSFSQSLIFFAYAAIFITGAHLIQIKKLNYEDMYTVFGAIIFGAMSIGQASQFAPDYGKAKASAARIFNLLDHNPSIDIYSDQGDKPEMCKGHVAFQNVKFCYPTRQTVTVLKDLSLQVEQGYTIALVGSSGCGKSTTVQLLERFYDALEGQVFIDGKDIKSLNVAWLRAQIGIVSQEPILFDCSIRENIEYGDNSRKVEMDEIISAARRANIHSFVETLPEGYETSVGDKGAQLSGGQKQRVAIARALVRNPKILLLDEATSALDTESEKIVQEALDRAQEGRTSLVIAHRLSTIQNASCIFVFHNGCVVEQGTHSQLMAAKGRYYKLNLAQGRNRKE